MEIGIWLDTHQTLVVGVAAFVGAMITLWYNGFLARRRHEIETLHQANVLRRSLVVELQEHKETLEDRRRILDAAIKDGSKPLLVPAKTQTEMYESLMDRMGLLSVDEVRSVMRAYAGLRHLPTNLGVLSGPAKNDFHEVKVEHFVMLDGWFENIAADVDTAITSITNETSFRE